MNVYDFMEGYDRSFEEDEFDTRLWEFVQREDFECTEEFNYFLHDYGIDDFHEFLKIIRWKKNMNRMN